MNRGAYDFLTKPIDFARSRERRSTRLCGNSARLRRRAAWRGRNSRPSNTNSARDKDSAIDSARDDSRATEISKSARPCCRRAQVSGDFYDFFLIDSNRLGLAIGDVSGKGIPAALFMAVSRTLLRATALHGASPRECLEHVNRVLLKQSESESFSDAAVRDSRSRDRRFRIQRRGAASARLCFQRRAKPVPARTAGHDAGSCWTRPRTAPRRFGWNRGDGLVLYTDGVTEAENSSDTFFSSHRLAGLVDANTGQPVDRMVDNILEGVRVFTQGREQSDDITMLAVQFKP